MFIQIMFTHPTQVCMTYLEHMRLSMHISFLFFQGACKAFVHSIYPDIFVTAASDTQREIAEILRTSGCR